MKTYTGIVTGQEITTNRDGEANVRMLQIEITEPDDVQGVQQITWSGDDNAPNNGDLVVIIEISESYKIVIGIQDQIEPEVEAGERKIYSQDGGEIKGYMYLKNTGEIEMNVKDQLFKVSNDNGFFELSADGQFNANDNLTVDA